MKRQKSKGGGGSNWMDTYGDMVTLLLCFFVLLYSMSTIDEQKWFALVRSFNPEAVKSITETSGNEGPSADPIEDGSGLEGELDPVQAMAMQAEIEESIEELYQALQEYADSSENRIEVTKGDGYVFVSFNEAVFFDGDRYALKPEGREVLSVVSDALSNAAPYIDEVRIMGHTAQANPNQPNNPESDRFLASNRATIATVFVQEHSTLDPARIISVGYGQHRPADTNETAEGRSHNRRVEFVITGMNVLQALGDSVEQYYSLRDGTLPQNSESSGDDAQETD